ncbi:hypothetical protein [Aliarcobacter butzleri]|uniref:hypothetical protein n=1 Tax=Aliarcobacter butzleri TaxID=28197 RepID=UPI00125EE41E|nr:hypothetical protein [Aliarcobacter butzleri]
MKILFYVEPLIEQDKPYWKDGWVGVFCNNIIKTLEQSENNYEFLIMTNEAIAQKVNIETPIIQLTQKELLAPFETTNYMDATKAWHCETYTSEQLENYKNLMSEKLNGFIPDIIITFSPVPFFREMLPNTLILHHEYSIFSRLPYPESWFLDPVGMHSNLFLNKFEDEIKSTQLTDKQTGLLNGFKELCQNILASKSPFKKIFDEKRKQFDYLVLLPLQFSRYYSFDDIVPFKSQYEYCVYVLDKVPSNIGVVVNTHPEYPVISKEAVEFLKTKYPNFIYEDEFNTIYASGQFILPFVDAVITVSSSLGLQTLLFDKKLITLSDKTFSFIADDTSIDNIENVLNSDNVDKNVFLYFMLTKYSLTSDYLHNAVWLDNFLQQSLIRFRANEIQFDFYDSIDEEEKIFMTLTKHLYLSTQVVPHYLDTKVIQLYIDDNTGYSEDNCIKFPIVKNEQRHKFKFDLQDSKSINNLRIDPLNDYCIIKINKIFINDLEINTIQCNACHIEGDIYYFNTNDPQIYFDTHNIKIVEKFSIDLEYLYIGEDALNHLVNDLLKSFTSKEQNIQTLNAELESKEQNIQTLNAELESKEQNIQEKSLDIAIIKQRLRLYHPDIYSKILEGVIK